jgi:hypothetical protein
MVDRYVAVLRTLMPKGKPFPRSALTSAAIAAWQASAPTVATRAKSGQSMWIQRRLALSSFCRYLVDVDILQRNPVKDVRGAGKLAGATGRFGARLKRGAGRHPYTSVQGRCSSSSQLSIRLGRRHNHVGSRYAGSHWATGERHRNSGRPRFGVHLQWEWDVQEVAKSG